MNSLILRTRLLLARHRELQAVVREAQADKPSDLPQFLAACQAERQAIEHAAAAIEAEHLGAVAERERLAGLRPRL